MGFQQRKYFWYELTSKGRRSNSNPRNFWVLINHSFNSQCIVFEDEIINSIIWIIVRQKNRKCYNKKTELFIKSGYGQTSQIKNSKN